jgi:hypothetical protein
MHKEASRIGDFGLTGIGSYLTAQMIPGVSSVANTAGGVAGALRDDALEEIKERGHAAKSLIPGVGAYRQGVIARAVADESGKRGRKQLLHEMIGSRLGNFGAGMAGAAGGAALAKKLGKEDKIPHLAVAGGIAGLIAPSAVAAIVALSTKTRTKREQDEAEKRNLLLNYIPGYGDYQYMKRLGRGYDKHFDKNITKKAGDQSMGYLTEALAGQTSEPRKQAVRDLLNKEAMGGGTAPTPGFSGSSGTKITAGDVESSGPVTVKDYTKKKKKKKAVEKVAADWNQYAYPTTLTTTTAPAPVKTQQRQKGANLATQLRNKIRQGTRAIANTTGVNPLNPRETYKNYVDAHDEYTDQIADGLHLLKGDAKKYIKNAPQNIRTGVKAGAQQAGKMVGNVETGIQNVKNFGKDVKKAYTSGHKSTSPVNKAAKKAEAAKKAAEAAMRKEGSDRKAAVRDYITKLADDGKCNEREGHYCPGCKGYGDSMTCSGCGENCGCAMSKEASDRKSAVRSLLKKEAFGPFGVTRGEGAKQYNQPAPWSAADTLRAESRFQAGYKGRPGTTQYKRGLTKYMKRMQQMRANQFKAQQAAKGTPDPSTAVDTIANNINQAQRMKAQ